MPRFSFKFAIFLQIACYLLGGHAAAHGLAWCLGADGHAHVEAADCATGQEQPAPSAAEDCMELSGGNPDHSHSGAECRHLPVTAPHAPGVAQEPRGNTGQTLSALPLLRSALHSATALSRLPCSPPSAQLPPTVEQVALCSVVLLQ